MHQCSLALAGRWNITQLRGARCEPGLRQRWRRGERGTPFARYHPIIRAAVAPCAGAPGGDGGTDTQTGTEIETEQAVAPVMAPLRYPRHPRRPPHRRGSASPAPASSWMDFKAGKGGPGLVSRPMCVCPPRWSEASNAPTPRGIHLLHEAFRLNMSSCADVHPDVRTPGVRQVPLGVV